MKPQSIWFMMRILGFILGIYYRDNGKENGSYYYMGVGFRV